MLHAVKVKPDVYWVGGIDWNERNFHGYTTDRGSTYNAYLIMDEQVTLIARYADRHALTPRERDVLALLLEGKDNQNIATSMHLAPSTVKVHMHHILQKAERANRKELIQDFWEFS